MERRSLRFDLWLAPQKSEFRAGWKRRKDVKRQDLAAPQGFEPRYSAPEADVLPLNEGAMR